MGCGEVAGCWQRNDSGFPSPRRSGSGLPLAVLAPCLAVFPAPRETPLQLALAAESEAQTAGTYQN